MQGSGARWVATFSPKGDVKVDVITAGNQQCDNVAQVAVGNFRVLSDERKPDGDCQDVQQGNFVNER